MAIVEGTTARYASERVSKLRLRILFGIYIISVLLAVSLGIVIALRHVPLIWSSVGLEMVCAVVGARIAQKIEKEIAAWKRGQRGELLVGHDLETLLLKSFRIIHDLKTDYGNLDHVVIGPPGIFAIETKNWRGTVSGNGNSELLWNERQYGKPHIANLTRRIMNVRDQVIALSKMDCFIQGVMIFPLAFLSINKGKIGTVDCIRSDEIEYYFITRKPPRRLSQKQIRTFANAFSVLAKMDKGFDHPS